MIFIFDLFPLIKKKSVKEIWIYLPIFILTLVLHFLNGWGIIKVNPANSIRHWISGWISS